MIIPVTSQKLIRNIHLAAVSGEPPELPPIEQELIGTAASAKHKLDVKRGRAAARRALQDLTGNSNYTILRGPRGEPIFPRDTIGSITHCQEHAIAVVANLQTISLLGIDLEALSSARDDLAEKIATPNEREWISKNSTFRIEALFAAKESIYKALAPKLKRFIGFQEVELLPLDLNSLKAKAQGELIAASDLVAALTIQLYFSSDAVLSIAYLENTKG